MDSVINRPPPQFKSRSSTPIPPESRSLKEEQEFESALSSEQLQMLEEENKSLLEGFEQMLNQIKFLPLIYVSY